MKQCTLHRVTHLGAQSLWLFAAHSSVGSQQCRCTDDTQQAVINARLAHGSSVGVGLASLDTAVRHRYMEAIGVEADCMEAMYNLGIVNKRLGCLDESLQAFEKLQSIIPDSIQVRIRTLQRSRCKYNSRQLFVAFCESACTSAHAGYLPHSDVVRHDGPNAPCD